MKLFLISLFIVFFFTISCRNEVHDNNSLYIKDELISEEVPNCDTVMYRHLSVMLDRFYNMIKKEDNISEDFFISLKYRIKPADFMDWGNLKIKKYDEAMILLFLKMYNSSNQGLYGDDLQNRLDKNVYLLLLADHFYEVSGKELKYMLFVSDIVNWVVTEYDYSKNEDIFNEVKKIKIKYPNFKYKI